MEALKITHDNMPQGLTLLLEMVNELIHLQANPATIAPVITNPESELLTRKEVAAKLKISLPTLGELTKNGVLPGYRVAGSNRLRYKSSEVNNALAIIKTSNIAA